MRNKVQLERSDASWIAIAAAAAGAGMYALSRSLEPPVASMPARHLQRARNLAVHSADVARRSPASTLASVAALAAGAYYLSNMRKSAREDSTFGSVVEESIIVDVPVRTAYNQWTQFEQFPQFMETVEQVRQVDDSHLHWRAKVAGKTKEWDAEITEQIPDDRIAWRSTSGPHNAGVVTFHRLSETRTRIMLQLEYKPETADEKVGSAFGAVKMTARNNLKKFKQLVEARGVETGEWRGTIGQQAH